MTDKQIIDKCPISEKCKEFENCKIQNILQQLKRKEQKLDRIAKVCDKFIPEYFKIITILEE